MLKSEVSVSDHYLATSDRVENFLYLKGIMKGLISTGGGECIYEMKWPNFKCKDLVIQRSI